MTGDKISSQAHKTGSWHLLGVLFKNSDEHPHPLYMEVSPPLPTTFSQGDVFPLSVAFTFVLRLALYTLRSRFFVYAAGDSLTFTCLLI